MRYTTLLLALAALAATSCSLQLDSQYGLRWEPSPIVRSEPNKSEVNTYPAQSPAEVNVPNDAMIAFNRTDYSTRMSQPLEVELIPQTVADSLPESEPEANAAPALENSEPTTEPSPQETSKSGSISFIEFVLSLAFFTGFLASLGVMGAIIGLTNWSGPGSMAGPGNLLGTLSAAEGLFGVIAMAGIALLCLVIIKALIS